MENQFDQAAMFSQMWMEFMSSLMKSAVSQPPGMPPTEAARNARSGGFQALSQYYEKLMRSPQWLEMMKQWMEMLMLFRRQMDENLTRMHHEVQMPAGEDIDNLMLTVRHLETRVLERIDELAADVRQIRRRIESEGEERNGNGRTASRRSARAADNMEASHD